MSITDRWSIVLIIIALVAIFIPILFTHNKLHEVRISFSKWAPQAPVNHASPPAMIAADQMITKVAADIQNYNNINVPLRFKNVTPFASKGSIAKPLAWVVQLVGLKDYGSTQLMVKRLQKKGFSAYAKPEMMGNKTYYRVGIGPVITRQEAEALLKALSMVVKVKAVIVIYDPVANQ
jgi:cell division septation protein DedD